MVFSHRNATISHVAAIYSYHIEHIIKSVLFTFLVVADDWFKTCTCILSTGSVALKLSCQGNVTFYSSDKLNGIGRKTLFNLSWFTLYQCSDYPKGGFLKLINGAISLTAEPNQLWNSLHSFDHLSYIDHTQALEFELINVNSLATNRFIINILELILNVIVALK